jgi:endonuclease/exonuclease/phosphatase family metal-dependent hydrolase
MLRICLLLLACLPLTILVACGSSETTVIEPVPDNPFLPYTVGTDTTFEAVTWNLHNFAQDAGNEEVALAAQAIAGLGADLVALQEIAQQPRFTQLLEQLPDWSGYMATSDSYQNLAYVWLDSTVSVQRVHEWLPEVDDAWRAFPRSPLVLELTWRGHELVVIDNHFKCCGNGVLDPDDSDDEENRRLRASTYLEEYIADEYPDQAVIMLGDLNDLLTDPPLHNVFRPFYDRPASYRFADQALAEGPASGWSWGPGQSHLDHILVTDELFPALVAPGADCRTPRIDQVLDGAYTRLLSDHLPVVLILPDSALP